MCPRLIMQLLPLVRNVDVRGERVELATLLVPAELPSPARPLERYSDCAPVRSRQS